MRSLYKNIKYWFEYKNRGNYHFWQIKAYSYDGGRPSLEGFLPLDKELTIQDALLLFSVLNLRKE